MTGSDLAKAKAYMLDLQRRKAMLMREGFHPQPLIDMEAGAFGLLGALGVDVEMLMRGDT